MGRHSCCYKQKLNKGLWSPEEDEKLIKHITTCGHGCRSSVRKRAGLQRCGKSCRLRWINYLRPDLKRGSFSPDEENLIIELHALLGGHKLLHMERYPLLENMSCNNLTSFPNSTNEFFLNRSVASHENSTTSCKPSDFFVFLSFQLPNCSSVNSNANLFFNSSPAKSSKLVFHDHFNISAVLASRPSSILSVSTRSSSPQNFPSNNRTSPFTVKFQNWDTCTVNNNGISTSHLSSNSFFENNAFPWGTPDCGKLGKRANLPSTTREIQEDVNWTEYMQTPFLLGNTIHNQAVKDDHIWIDLNPK